MASQHPTLLTADRFSELVRKSKLVDQDKLDAVLSTFWQRTGADGTAAGLAELLVQAKLLTVWQAQKLLAGEVDGFFLGRYELLSQLGKGAMGTIYLAEHVRMRRRAAVKILPPKFVEDARRRELFYRESEATAALDHPHVVRAYDVDNHGEIYYLVMEYVEGADLDQIVSQEGPLHFTRAAKYVMQAADGLAHAHERGIIHRDVKPSNLMLDLNDCIKILDMGLSHWEEIAASPSTGRGDFCGTPDYIAPELLSGDAQVDACSDIYNLGCTFCFLVAGRPPFLANTVSEVLSKHRREPPPSLRELVPDVPLELDEIYLGMMAKRPEDRISSAKEIWSALRDWEHQAGSPVPSLIDRQQGPKSGQPSRVLVAEDDEVTQQMLSMQLQKAGFEVRVASDGQEAIDMLDSQITVCLFDLHMPRATGMDCLRHVQCHFPDTPVIILTASGEIHDAIAAMREGAFDYLTKPCRILNVLTRVEEAIRSRRRSAEDGDSLNSLILHNNKETTGTQETLVIDQASKAP